MKKATSPKTPTDHWSTWDIHRETASKTLGVPTEQVTPEQRLVARAINFGVLFGKKD